MIIVSKYDHVNLCAVGWYCCWLVLLVFCCVPSYIIVMFSEELKTFKRLGFRHVSFGPLFFLHECLPSS